MSSEKVILNKKEIEKINKALQKSMSKQRNFFVVDKELVKEMFMEDLLDFIKNY